jgi:hypothetical protein
MAKRNPAVNPVKKISVKTADGNAKDKRADQPTFGGKVKGFRSGR